MRKRREASETWAYVEADFNKKMEEDSVVEEVLTFMTEEVEAAVSQSIDEYDGDLIDDDVEFEVGSKVCKFIKI